MTDTTKEPFISAQEFYKWWIREKCDDSRGDWPIRFATAYKDAYAEYLKSCNK